MYDWLLILRSPTAVAVLVLELAERSAYYGLVFSLTTFVTLMMRRSTGEAYAITNAIFAVAPLSAIVAGVLADTRFRRVDVLVVTAAIYTVALAFMTGAAAPGEFGDGRIAAPTQLPFALFIPGLILFSIGYGAFKVCTAPLLAESVLAAFEAKQDAERIASLVVGGAGAGEALGEAVRAASEAEAAAAVAAGASPGSAGSDGASEAGSSSGSGGGGGGGARGAGSASVASRGSRRSAIAETDDRPREVVVVAASDAATAADAQARRERVVSATFSVYAGIINLGSLIGFTAIPSLRFQGGSRYDSTAAGASPRPDGFVYSWGACLGFSAGALAFFIAVTTLQRRWCAPGATSDDDGKSDDDAEGRGARRASDADPLSRLRDFARALGLPVCACCESAPPSAAAAALPASASENASIAAASDDTPPGYAAAPPSGPCVDEAALRRARSLRAVLKVFFVLPFYWLVGAMTSSSFQVQAYCGSLPSWATVEMLNNFNTIAFLVTLPLMQLWTSWMAGGVRGGDGSSGGGGVCGGAFRSVLTLRLTIGYLVSVVALAAAGAVQLQINAVAVPNVNGTCTLLDPRADAAAVLPGVASISLPFLISGIASGIVDPAALEAAFELAAPDMRSTVMSVYLLESSLAGFIGLALTPVFEDPRNFAAGFFGFAGFMVAVTGAWAWLVRGLSTYTAAAAPDQLEERLLLEPS
jgi:dipeptide/tripeptide permease